MAPRSDSVPDLTAHDEFSVGDCHVYPADNAVRCGDKTIPLEPKAMALLFYLARNAGSTISRDQLFEAVWPGVVVSDDTLTQVVTKLRKAFGDDAKRPRYIQTVPKRGYRLCAPVAFDAQDTKSFRVSSWSRSRYLVAATLILTTVIMTVFFMANRRAETPGQSLDKMAVSDGLPTLSVQPFELLGDDDSQDYLAQGLTYDLTTGLSKLSGLLIIGSRSIMGQKTDQPVTNTVRYWVQGEVQQLGKELRVHVHLFDAENGHQLWSERYLQPIDNIFEIQEEISRKIVSALAIRVDEEEYRRLAHRYTRSVHAYDLFLRAQSLLLVRLKNENEEARKLFRKAIDLDPSFARAYGGLALSFAADFRNQWVLDGSTALQRAHAMARTALEIDPEIPEIYWVLAYINAQQRHHKKAIGLLRKAVSLDQSFADAYALMGGIKTYMGQPDETLGLLRTAVRLNPDAGYLYFLLLGRAYFFLGDWEQALINISEALERNPTNLEARVYLAALHESTGAHEDATWQRDEILALEPDFTAETWLRTYPMSDRGQLLRLSSTLHKLDL